MSMSSSMPPLHRGWLKKLSRTGVMKNWKARYIVLEGGLITYFEKKLPRDMPPYGENKKGDLFLKGATVAERKDGACRLYITSQDDAGILFEADNPEVAREWLLMIKGNIEYANRSGSSRKIVRTDSVSENQSIVSADDVDSLLRPTERNTSLTEMTEDEQVDEERANRPAEESITIRPNPGFVIKTKKKSGEKVFINVCEHASVPSVSTAIGTLKTNTKWPTMVSSNARTFQDDDEKKGKSESAIIFDVAVNPAVLELSNKDESLSTRDLLCHRIIKHIRLTYDDSVDIEYKLPKVSKRYKGSIEPLVISTSETKKRSKSLFPGMLTTSSSTRQISTDPPSETSDDSPKSPATSSKWGKASVSSVRALARTSSTENGSGRMGDEPTPPRRGSTMSMSSSSKGADQLAVMAVNRFRNGLTTNMNSMKQVVGAVIGPTASRIMEAVADIVRMKRYVPYSVTRMTGVIARSKPHNDSEGKRIPFNEQIFVCARKRIGDTVWLKTLEGWIQECGGSGGEKQISLATNLRQPIGAAIASTRMVEVIRPPKKGWFYNEAPSDDDATFTLKFTIDLMCPEDTKVKLTRTYSDIIALRKCLLTGSDKAVAARVQKQPFPGYEDGDPDLLNQTALLASFVENLSTWLREVVRFVNLERCKIKEYRAFLTPNDADCDVMETELLADGGMEGAWSDELKLD